METDAQGRFTYTRKTCINCSVSGARKSSAELGKSAPVDASEPGLLKYQTALARLEPFCDLEYSVYVAEKGTVGYAAFARDPVFKHGEFFGYCGVVRDITERIMTKLRLPHLAICDTLTGLPNRDALATPVTAACQPSFW